MGEISGKVLGILATVAVFIVVTIAALYPAISELGSDTAGSMSDIEITTTGGTTFNPPTID